MRNNILSEHDTLLSEEWFDQPRAHEFLDSLAEQHVFIDEHKKQFEDFIERGFAVLDLSKNLTTIEQLAREFDVLWETRFVDLMAAHNSQNRGRPQPLALFPDDFQRGPSTRIIDVHGHSSSALSLMLNETIHGFIHHLYRAPVLATQTLFFEYGSTQNLHRDPWYVQTNPPTHLCACWIALEDISPDSGPLLYVPGSNKWPYYRFSNDDVLFNDKSVTPEERQSANRHLSEQLSDSGDAVQFCPKKGQALIWHHSLVHGGSPVRNAALTRKSLVIHFDKLKPEPKRFTTWVHNGHPVTTAATQRLHFHHGHTALDAPFKTISNEDRKKIDDLASATPAVG